MNDDRIFLHDMKNMLGIIIGFSNLLLEGMPEEDPHRGDVDEIRLAAEGAIALLARWSQANLDRVKGDTR
ncbi:MAG: hypothetical protein ND807_01335 [Vicinamibacterales bacterium]|nr:hypothetical protein [Vicinamibacterales bacterium]